jgi:spore coat polysaccharide biosynthesis protein SpsF
MNQEQFWAGQFGNDYIDRNNNEVLLSSNIHFFSNILSRMSKLPSSVIELGANVGMNIKALKELLPASSFTGVEINKTACAHLETLGCTVHNASIQEIELLESFDLVLSKGVLIHLNPDSLSIVYQKLYDYTNEWILLAEYYNPVPVAIDYRGHSDKLFKRDFAGEILAKYKDLELVATGFAYHLDQFPQDDITWFLIRKNKTH